MTVNLIDDKMYVLIPDEGYCLFNEVENVYSESVYTSKEDDIWSWEEIPSEDIIIDNEEGEVE